MEPSTTLGSATPDDTAPQSAASLLDLELLAVLPPGAPSVVPPDAPSMPPPAWVIDDEEDERASGDEDPMSTPWRPHRGVFIAAFMVVQVCFFVIGLAGARTAYARLGTEPPRVASVTHRKSPTVDRIFAVRDVGHRHPKGRAALRRK